MCVCPMAAFETTGTCVCVCVCICLLTPSTELSHAHQAHQSHCTAHPFWFHVCCVSMCVCLCVCVYVCMCVCVYVRVICVCSFCVPFVFRSRRPPVAKPSPVFHPNPMVHNSTCYFSALIFRCVILFMHLFHMLTDIPIYLASPFPPKRSLLNDANGFL